MATRPISDRGRMILARLAHHRGPVLVADLARELRTLGDLGADIGQLIEDGTVVAQSTMTQAQLEAERQAVWQAICKAQQTGAPVTFRTRNTFRVELSKIGRDLIPLLAGPRPRT